ncbi:hypothetical protein E2C01_062202 [Portunus trituberculatus]|uniref:Uncharacterized protein n=1 Tax=Portunus trituberculatus TaxID=210409 RepID=A0A5B7HCZ8_PORTR|nr:hypothetical protein [Portunus trituberculatus]
MEAQDGRGPQLQQAWAQCRPNSAQLQQATSGHGLPHIPFFSKHCLILNPADKFKSLLSPHMTKT